MPGWGVDGWVGWFGWPPAPSPSPDNDLSAPNVLSQLLFAKQWLVSLLYRIWIRAFWSTAASESKSSRVKQCETIIYRNIYWFKHSFLWCLNAQQLPGLRLQTAYKPKWEAHLVAAVICFANNYPSSDTNYVLKVKRKQIRASPVICFANNYPSKH